MDIGGSEKERSSVFLDVFISFFLVSILIVSTVPVSLASVACKSDRSNEGKMIESPELDDSYKIYVEKKARNIPTQLVPRIQMVINLVISGIWEMGISPNGVLLHMLLA